MAEKLDLKLEFRVSRKVRDKVVRRIIEVRARVRVSRQVRVKVGVRDSRKVRLKVGVRGSRKVRLKVGS